MNGQTVIRKRNLVMQRSENCWKKKDFGFLIFQIYLGVIIVHLITFEDCFFLTSNELTILNQYKNISKLIRVAWPACGPHHLGEGLFFRENPISWVPRSSQWQHRSEEKRDFASSLRIRLDPQADQPTRGTGQIIISAFLEWIKLLPVLPPVHSRPAVVRLFCQRKASKERCFQTRKKSLRKKRTVHSWCWRMKSWINCTEWRKNNCWKRFVLAFFDFGRPPSAQPSSRRDG